MFISRAEFDVKIAKARADGYLEGYNIGYAQGYKEGVLGKCTPNEIRKALELPPIDKNAEREIVEKKRRKLVNQCAKIRCEKCPLRDQEWLHEMSGRRCLDFAQASEAEIDRALCIIGDYLFAEKRGELSITKSDNPYWDRITDIAKRQRSKGIKEYGRGVEDDTAGINVRLDRIEEELIDTLMYLEHLRDGINRIKEVVG